MTQEEFMQRFVLNQCNALNRQISGAEVASEALAAWNAIQEACQ